MCLNRCRAQPAHLKLEVFRALIVLTALASLAPGSSQAQTIQPVEEEVRALRFDASQFEKLELLFVYANVNVRNGPRSQVLVHFRKRASPGRPKPVYLRATISDGVLQVVSQYWASKASPPAECLPPQGEFGAWDWEAQNLVEIDLEIPASLQLNASSLRGDFNLLQIQNAFTVTGNDGVVSFKDQRANIEIRARGAINMVGIGDAHTLTLSVYDGEANVVTKPNTDLLVGAQSISSRPGELQVARSDSAAPVSLHAVVGAMLSLDVELTRASLLLSGK